MTRRAVTGITLYDGSGGPPVPGTSVVWDDRRIISVGTDASADTANAEVITTGGWVVPGLIDAHVHLTLDATVEGMEGVATEPVETTIARARSGARILLGAGITTARDQGSRNGLSIQVAGEQRSGTLTAARIMAAGRGITPTGGHGWMIGVEADGADGVRAAVAAEIAAGADVIKLFPTGGILGSGAHGYAVVMSAEEIAAAIDEAHRHGILVGAHVHGPPGIEMVLDAGIDTIEHATAITNEQIDRVIEQGVALVPTLTGAHLMLEVDAGLPSDLLARAIEVKDVAFDGIQRAIAGGARVLAGTDAGTPFNPPGGLVTEMTLLSDLGYGPQRVLAAATSWTAETLRLDGLGKVAEGMIADMVVLDGDPVEDLAWLTTPRLVFQDGGTV